MNEKNLLDEFYNIRKMYAKLIYSYFSGLMSMIKLIYYMELF